MSRKKISRKSGSSRTESINKKRGPDKVKAKLIRSACSLLARQGPRSVTIRDIAAKAGVNHGQIHHYFGGKKQLITEAVRHLAREHLEHAKQRGLDEFDAPPALSLAKDNEYLMTVIRCVQDGELKLATMEIKEGVSVPHHILEIMPKLLGKRKLTVDMKAALATSMAIELGWASMEAYILAMNDVNPDEVDQVRDKVAKAAREPLKVMLKKRKS